MNIIKPPTLQKGDTIGILAISGSMSDNNNLDNAADFFKNLGYKIKLSDNINSNYEGMAGSDYERVNALHDMFSDDSVDAIIALRGGFGALRLIDKIDYDIIKENPKIFCGYSDITILNAMFLKKAHLATFSGPMILSDFCGNEISEYTINNFFDTLSNNKSEFSKIYEGKRFWGGNLTSLASLAGIDFVPDFKFDLFLEDINEPAYKIDRMVRQLMNIKKLRKNVRSIYVGDFTGTDNKNYLDKIFEEMSDELKVPLNKDFPASHSKIKATIPYGITL